MFKFYCERPSCFLRDPWKSQIDAVIVKGFGGPDPGMWLADRILIMTLDDLKAPLSQKIVAVSTLDLYDYEIKNDPKAKRKRLWIESLTIPDHPIKKDISLFSLFWEFIWEVIGSDFPQVPKNCVSLLVAKHSKDEERLIGIYKAKGFVVVGVDTKEEVKIGKRVYRLMEFDDI